MEQIKVKAAPGVRVPMERAHRKYITENEAVLVNATPYYRLRIRDQDLVLIDDATSTANADGPTASAVVAPAAPTTDAHTEVPAAEQPADIAPADHHEVQ